MKILEYLITLANTWKFPHQSHFHLEPAGHILFIYAECIFPLFFKLTLIHSWFQIDTLSKVSHKNFASLLGFCVEEQPFTRMMVFEYAPNGTLFEHLHSQYFLLRKSIPRFLDEIAFLDSPTHHGNVDWCDSATYWEIYYNYIPKY